MAALVVPGITGTSFLTYTVRLEYILLSTYSIIILRLILRFILRNFRNGIMRS